MNAQRILVTGGAGFIGSNLVRHLLSQSDVECVVNLDALTYAGNPENLSDLNEPDRYHFQEGRIQDRDLVKRLLKDHHITHVLNLAAESHVDRSIEGPDAFIQTNIVGTFECLEACRDLKKEANRDIRFIHVSTDEVYGSLGDEGKFTEQTPYAPNSPYAASKASSDLIVRAYNKTYGMPCVITNCSNNYGPYQFPEKLIPLVTLRATRDESLPVYGKGENVRDWLYVSDHAEALHLVAKHGNPGETYNIGGDQEVQNIELVRRICDILDRLKPRANGSPHSDLIEFVKDRPGHDLRYAIDASKLQSELGWKPRHDVQSGLESTVKWYLNHSDWCDSVLKRGYELQRLGL